MSDTLFVVCRCEEGRFLRVQGFATNEGSSDSQASSLFAIEVFLDREREVFSNQCVSLR